MADLVTCKQMLPYLGKSGNYVVQDFTIRVRILDVAAYSQGLMQFLIEPLSGKSNTENWVLSSLVELDREGADV